MNAVCARECRMREPCGVCDLTESDGMDDVRVELWAEHGTQLVGWGGICVTCSELLTGMRPLVKNLEKILADFGGSALVFSTTLNHGALRSSLLLDSDSSGMRWRGDCTSRQGAPGRTEGVS
jgi:hypothetical protein